LVRAPADPPPPIEAAADEPPIVAVHAAAPGSEAPPLIVRPTGVGVVEGLSGPAKGITARVTEVVVIGRGLQCDIRVAGDSKVSSRHCRVELRPEGFFLVDVGSSNGTVVNGARVTEVPLTGGETIMLGRSLLRFRIEGAG
jgi:pSer/pThr/pTyr-binding forkhead associated (FHA) protein